MREHSAGAISCSELIILALVSMFVLAVDCFGVSARTDSFANEIVVKFAAPFYAFDRRAEIGHEDHNAPITVVLIDEAFLRSVGHSWPLDHSDYARLIRRVSTYGPRAIFLDLMFLDSRGDPQGTEVLAESIARARSKPADKPPEPIPVFIAAPSPCLERPLGPEHDQRQEVGRGVLRALTKVAQPVLTDWSGFGESYPLALDPEELRLSTRNLGAACYLANDGPPTWDTPALALYRAWCRVEDSDECGWMTPLPDSTARGLDEPMLVRWGVTTSRLQAAFSDAKECLVEPSVEHRSWLSLSALINASLGGIFRWQESLSPCAYTVSMSASALIPTSDLASYGSDENYEGDLEQLLKDRIVLIGSGLLGSGDTVLSPPNGSLPGVYAHAMALDNLMELGDSYLRLPWDPDLTMVGRLLWIDLALVAFFTLLGGFASQRVLGSMSGTTRRDRAGQFAILFLSATALATLAFAIGCGASFLWHTAPRNFVAAGAGVFAAYSPALVTTFRKILPCSGSDVEIENGRNENA